LTKIRKNLTPVAAFCLLIIMIGAVVISIMGPGVGAAILPFVVGILCAVIAYGRRDWMAR
jgi:energy-converting hydrogenase Eha subunit A